jgi:hypothetical protein
MASEKQGVWDFVYATEHRRARPRNDPYAGSFASYRGLESFDAGSIAAMLKCEAIPYRLIYCAQHQREETAFLQSD